MKRVYPTLFYLGAVTLLALIALPAAHAQTIYNPVADFSPTVNGGGNPWSYGYATTSTMGSFTAFTNHVLWSSNAGLDIWEYGPPGIFHNSTASPIQVVSSLSVAPGQLGFDLADDTTLVPKLRLTLPSSGDYVLSAIFTEIDTAPQSAMNIEIMINGTTTVLSDQLTAVYGTSSAVTNYAFFGTAGTTIDFAFWTTGSPVGDHASLSATVTAVPEPSTCAALFGLAALSFAALVRLSSKSGGGWRRRRRA